MIMDVLALAYDLNNGQSNSVVHSDRQPRQWCHIGGKYCRELRRLKLWLVGQKLTYDPGQHAKSWGTHQKTRGNAQGCRGRARQNRTTNGDFFCINEIKLPDLDNAKTKLQGKNQYNWARPPVNTHSYPSYSPLEDALVAPAVPS